ncbi:unnamed protein product [Lupinus luteus]|uniref:Cytochrome P450 n=1 Tax=Lupinus luteus TaxID=3873 RepID=A0AAV1WVK5_LUPLU
MELNTMFFFFASFLFIVLFKSLIKSFFFHSRERELPLPPGSMGWPYIGETFQLYTQDPNVFFATKIKSKERMLGKQAIFFHQGEYHGNLRRLVLRTFMPETIKNIVPDIESIAQTCLQSCQGKLITTFLEMKTFTFNVALVSIFGKDEMMHSEDLKQCYYTVEKGYNSMAINLPGTLFHKAMKARKKLSKILSQIISSRRRRMQMKQDCYSYNDLLGCLMNEKARLNDEQIADNIIGVIFAAHDTTATVLTWIVKEAIKDVEYQGYLIPKGWKVLPLFRNIHHSSEFFKEAEKFDPSRFEVAPKPNTFMPFGDGIHACPGNELAKLEILVLLHHLTTKYSWSVVGGDNGIQYGPFALPPNGLPITLYHKK